ncbi:hypothetical protein K439DRAFT_1351612, partial [Ramaria rubella]
LTSMATTLTKPSVQSFEFTKRKRWTETLFSEISETLFLIVSPSCKVLYCGSAVVDLLGWKEDQLVDADLGHFIEDEDQDNFRWSFTESLRSGQDLFTYARFKCDRSPSPDKNAKSGLLFELKGHAHFIQGQQQPQCFFLSAMPYPCKDIAMLNSFIDLRIENEKLSQRIQHLKKSAESTTCAIETPFSSRFPLPQHPEQLSQPPGLLIPNHSSLYSRATTSSSFYPLSEASGSGLRNHKTPMSAPDDITIPPINGSSASSHLGDDDFEDQRKKKVAGDEQRVCRTCGRTDSPEWRKGPNGPKTLCNACGLRWAKRTRKAEPDIVTPPPNPKNQDDAPDPDSLGFGGQQMMF